MLIGEETAKITQKNRVAVPKKFRNKLKGDIFITRGYEKCLIILDKKRWDNLIKSIELKPFLNKSVRDTKRFILGGAEEINMDSQGRFVLSQNQKKYANLDKKVMFVGISDWLELWNFRAWENKIKELTESADEIAQRLLE